ncbi:MAG TPA: fluoride efflux transporter CrcB [Candidatus Tectomicrobia bacterium]|nr:fluoride efflux transporter CrcB [Candidatus Tectomicrobia bacterium]
MRARGAIVRHLLLVALGGALGSLARYLVASAALAWLGPGFPYGTLAVNLVGSFSIGVVQALAFEGLAVPEGARLFIVTGVLGGLTTYSAFSYETARLAQTGAWTEAAVNVVVTTAGCVLLCALGLSAGRSLAGG